MAEKAYRFISVGGKTFYFNIYETHGGTHNYISIVVKKGNETEKLVMFPNQVPSFVHCLLETYTEVCKREDVPNPYTTTGRGVDSTGTRGEEKKDEPLVKPRCPQCDEKLFDLEDPFPGALMVKKSGEEDQNVSVLCEKCRWVPQGASSVDERNGAIFYPGNSNFDYWVRFVAY